MSGTTVERWQARMHLVEGCSLPETVPALLDAAADRYSERPALIFFEDDVMLSYGALRELTCRLANGLEQIGVVKGTRVGVISATEPNLSLAGWRSHGSAQSLCQSIRATHLESLAMCCPTQAPLL